jgi:hypothetical protein
MNNSNSINQFLPFACFCALFITPSTAAYIDINSVVTLSYGPFLFILLGRTLFSNKTRILKKQGVELQLTFLFIAYTLTRLAINQTDYIQSAFSFLLIPVSIGIALSSASVKIKRNCVFIVLTFFVVECILAVYEKYTSMNLFPYRTGLENPYVTKEDWEFRSSALLGHPLMNALCMSTILGFILVGRFSYKLKIASIAITLLAILCFNARGATLVVFIYSTYFIVQNFVTRKRNLWRDTMHIFLFVCLGLSFFFLASHTSLGGRIINQEKIIDGSAQTRLDVLKSFSYLKNYDLWIGNPDLYMPITNALGAAGVENSYVVIIIRYGLLMGIPIILCLFWYVKKELEKYSRTDKLILTSSFLLVGSMNNSLSVPAPWIVFIICCKTFPYFNQRA